MTVIKHKQIDTAYNIYLSLYQGLADNNHEDAYKQFSPEFFDLVIVDECHRGSAREDSKWREILEYFKGATHIGLTATPKEAFKNTEDNTQNACCAAQMFLDDGDGVVFLGDEGKWQTERRGEYHLNKSAAKNLLSGILRTYDEQHGKALKEIFLHCRSSLNAEEFSGYLEACPPGVKLIGIRVAPDRSGLRLYRTGTRPVLRGSFWQVSDRRGYLWGSGFKPRLQTYDGSEVPVPKGLLDSGADRVLVVLCFNDGDRDIWLVVEDVVGPLLCAAYMHLASDIDAAIRETHFLSYLRFNIPSRRSEIRGNELTADVAFA